MTHKFDAGQKNKLDNPERRKLLPPKETLQKLLLSSGDIVADIGCGIGYFTLPAAELAGPQGTVFAIDIAETMLAEIKTRAIASGLTNITTVKAKENSFPLPDQAATFGLVCFVLHEADNLEQFVDEITRIIAAGGRLAVLEWEKKITPNGPPVEHRLAKEVVVQMLAAKGFSSIQTIELNEQHYALIAQKE